MGALTQIVSRVAGGGRRTARPGRPAAGAARPTGTTGGSRAQDEAIGRGVRSLLGKLRR
jgi:hypothetical protein